MGRRRRSRRAFMWRFERANRIWLQALQISSPPRRAPHACEFVHGWSEAARAANFETLAAYGRLYLIARARHSSGASTGRPDPLLSPSRRRRGLGSAPWACHSAYRTARKSYVFIARAAALIATAMAVYGCVFWPRGGPSRERQDLSSRCAGVAGRTLGLTRSFFLQRAGFAPNACGRGFYASETTKAR